MVTEILRDKQTDRHHSTSYYKYAELAQICLDKTIYLGRLKNKIQLFVFFTKINLFLVELQGRMTRQEPALATDMALGMKIMAVTELIIVALITAATMIIQPTILPRLPRHPCQRQSRHCPRDHLQ